MSRKYSSFISSLYFSKRYFMYLLDSSSHLLGYLFCLRNFLTRLFPLYIKEGFLTTCKWLSKIEFRRQKSPLIMDSLKPSSGITHSISYSLSIISIFCLFYSNFFMFLNFFMFFCYSPFYAFVPFIIHLFLSQFLISYLFWVPLKCTFASK